MTVTNADIRTYAARLDAAVTRAAHALDDEHADRQVTTEQLICDVRAIAAQMRADAPICDMPECTDPAHTTAGVGR